MAASTVAAGQGSAGAGDPGPGRQAVRDRPATAGAVATAGPRRLAGKLRRSLPGRPRFFGVLLATAAATAGGKTGGSDDFASVFSQVPQKIRAGKGVGTLIKGRTG